MVRELVSHLLVARRSPATVTFDVLLYVVWLVLVWVYCLPREAGTAILILAAWERWNHWSNVALIVDAHRQIDELTQSVEELRKANDWRACN